MKDIKKAFLQAMKDMGINPKDREVIRAEISINFELESEMYIVKKQVKTIIYSK